MQTFEDDDGPEPWPVGWEEGEEYRDFARALSKESDRGQVLSVAHYMDILLERTVRAFLVEGKAANDLLTGFNAPLGTFSVRISAARAMGLIDDHEANALIGVRELRNAFAHTVAVDLEAEKVLAATRKLAKYAGLTPHHPPFVCYMAGMQLASALLNRAYHAEQQRLSQRAWPMHRPSAGEIDARAARRGGAAAVAPAAAPSPKPKKVRPSRGAPKSPGTPVAE
ncbi:hypothetical protein [Caulobacter segnis]